ncbi:MAG: hypothetical protein M3R06_01935 [Chloroflexota bacterium]|nr:hypothetical protein [Chloroflexota bacterium]
MTRRGWAGIFLAAVVIVALMRFGATLADHESSNSLSFAPVEESAAPEGSGTGLVDYRGGREPKTRWTVQFSFDGLQANQPYSVVILGRFGDDGTPAATTFAEVCAFTTDSAGKGGCWYYPVSIRRLSVVQLRASDATGTPVLQATREEGGPGAIVSQPNRFSPAATPGSAPLATP